MGARVGGIVLCGGHSTRMGRDKALLEWNARPLVVHVCEQVSAAVDGPIVVVAAAGQELPPLPARAELARDLVADQGPLEGLRTGLRTLSGRAELVFVTSVDAPHLRPELVAALLRRLDDADAVMPATAGFAHPLTAVYRVSLVPLVEAVIAEGERRVRRVGERCRAVLLERDELLADAALRAVDPALRCLDDVDTPDDLMRASL
ncbi:MAG: molybdenum cofactor guanylyltransferase [Gaiellales bacterium]